MKQYKSIDALCKIVGDLLKETDEHDRRPTFVRWIVEDLELNQSQAEAYANCVLRGPPLNLLNNLRANSNKLIGHWAAASMSGQAGALLATSSEHWIFQSNLNYENRTEKYEGYTSLTLSYSRPSQSSVSGIWVPTSSSGDASEVLLLRPGYHHTMAVRWPAPNERAAFAISLSDRPYGKG